MDAWVNEARAALMQRRSSLHAMLRSFGEERRELRVERAREVLDAVVEVSREEVLERLSEQERRELRDIDDALVRIEEGWFGQCVRCGGAIGRHRLRAIPEARHCVACSAAEGRRRRS
jgi:DnaK suppressor protein